MEEAIKKPAAHKQYVHMGMFDLVKGLGILFIFAEHFLQTVDLRGALNMPFLWVLVHNMIIPMYFLTSGYGFTHRRTTAALWKQIRSMLRVYVLTGCFIVISSLVLGYLYMHSLIELFVRAAQYALGYLLGMPYHLVIAGHYFAFSVGAVWFIVSDILCMLFMEYVVSRVSLKKQIAIVVLLAVLGSILGSFINLPFGIIQAMLGFSCFYLGWQLKQTGYFTSISRKKGCILVLCAVLWVIGTLYGRIDFADCQKVSLPVVLCAGAGGLAFTHLTVLLSVYRNFVFSGIQWLGRNTLYLIALDSGFTRFVNWNALNLSGPLLFGIEVCFLVFGYLIVHYAGKSAVYRDLVNKIENKCKNAHR